MLELVDIHSYYGDSHIVKGISLRVSRGSIVAIVGPNGVGKTTTLHSIIGFIRPRYGEVRFKGINTVGLPANNIARMGVSLVPQGRRIFPSLTVKENLIVAAHNRGNKYWTLERIVTTFPLLVDRASHRGNQLSGGEQQLLAVARSLAGNPDLLLLDEVSEGFSPSYINAVVQIVRWFKEANLSVLLAESNLRLVTRVADYVYVMSKGTIVYESEPENLIDNEEIKSRYFGVST